MRVNKKNIEKIFEKIDEKFMDLEQNEQITILEKFEKRANLYNDGDVSKQTEIKIAFEKIKSNFSRIYSEGKSKKTLNTIKRHVDRLEYEINNFQYFNNEEISEVIKCDITYLEIMLNMDVSFFTSLINIYKECLKRENDFSNDKEKGGKKR